MPIFLKPRLSKANVLAAAIACSNLLACESRPVELRRDVMSPKATTSSAPSIFQQDNRGSSGPVVQGTFYGPVNINEPLQSLPSTAPNSAIAPQTVQSPATKTGTSTMSPSDAAALVLKLPQIPSDIACNGASLCFMNSVDVKVADIYCENGPGCVHVSSSIGVDVSNVHAQASSFGDRRLDASHQELLLRLLPLNTRRISVRYVDTLPGAPERNQLAAQIVAFCDSWGYTLKPASATPIEFVPSYVGVAVVALDDAGDVQIVVGLNDGR